MHTAFTIIDKATDNSVHDILAIVLASAAAFPSKITIACFAVSGSMLTFKVVKVIVRKRSRKLHRELDEI